MAISDKGIKFSNLSTFKQEMDVILNGKVSTSDSRLSDARPASDVYSWAKAATKPTYTASEVGALATEDISDWAKAANKPSYNASEVGAIATSARGAINGVASLGADGKVPSNQLPAYVDDVIEGYLKATDGKFYKENTYGTEISAESGKIYTDLSTNKTYRWSGSQYTQIKGDLSIGETTGSAFDGKKGKDLETAVLNLLTVTSNIPSDFTWATDTEVRLLFSV